MLKRLLAGLLALTIIAAYCPTMAFATGDEDAVISDGIYRIEEGVTEVTIVGSGEEEPDIIRIDCTAAPGIHLTLQDVDVSVEGGYILHFSGTQNVLTAEGICLLERMDGEDEAPLIQMEEETEMAFDGDGVLYLYGTAPVSDMGSFAVNGATISIEGGPVGGTWCISGGSVRVNWAEDAVIVSEDGEPLYLCKVDVSSLEADTYTVEADGEQVYSGPGYDYSRSENGWAEEKDPCLYLYLTGEDHELTINDTACTYYWDPLMECFDLVPHGIVSFSVTPADAKIVISEGIGYTYTEKTYEGKTVDGVPQFSLAPGVYTATITKDGCYASQFSFRVTDETRITSINTTSNVKNYLDGNGVFTIVLTSFQKSTNPSAWDGVTLDVSWYSEYASTLYIATPAQLAGMAAICNGIYNAEITTILDDANGDGVTERYTPVEYAVLSNRKIRPVCVGEDSDRVNDGNQVTTSSYWYGAKYTGTFTHNGKTLPMPADFSGQTVYLTADLDMGGFRTDGGWTGARYMTIGGQSLMHYIDYAAKESDGYSHIGSSFNGHLEGQGHIVKNLYCDRNASGSNYGDSSAVGLVGRLGTHDNDPAVLAAVDPSIRNLAVTGYVFGRRSVGGIVGKIGKSTAAVQKDGSTGAIIENCLNFCEVRNTDAKGVGGIAGAAWNRGLIQNCANLGSVYAAYKNAGGISGSCEVQVVNCYNAGYVSAVSVDYAQALGTDNGGAVFTNCYWLTGSSFADSDDSYRYPAVYRNDSRDTITEITSFEAMTGEDFLARLNGDGRAWVQISGTDAICAILDGVRFENCKLNTAGVSAAGFPVPRAFVNEKAAVVKVEKLSDPEKLSYVEGQSFDPNGLRIQATYSDGTTELLTDYTVSPAGALAIGVDTVNVSGTCGGVDYSYDFPITVVKKAVSEIRIHKAPDNTIYAADEQITLSGMEIAAYFTDFPDTPVILEEGSYEAALDGAELTVTYTCDGKTVSASMTFTILASDAPEVNQDGYYELDCPDDLTWFANQVSNVKNTGINGLVIADIAADSLFMGIGKAGSYFAGTFDGGNHTITLNMATDGTAGLFTGVSGGRIQNVRVAGSVSSDAASSGIAGVAAYVGPGGAVIENCVNEAAVTGGGYVGGIVGKTASATVTVTNCENHGKITAAADYAGGICGYVTGEALIADSVNKGAVSGVSRVGGIVGYTNGQDAEHFVRVERCGNDGTVSGASTLGGILGYSESEFDRIRMSYNAGAVTAGELAGNSGVGGLAGFFAGSVDSCYNYGTVSCTGNGVLSELNSAGVGGLLGLAYGCKLENCYQSGSVSGDGSSSVKSGSLVGFVYYGTSSAVNTYYLESDGLVAFGGTVNDSAALTGDYTAKTSGELMALADVLGSNFRNHSNRDYHGGYPVLVWENADHTHVWDAAVVTKDPTCTEPGQRKMTCVDCGVTLTEEIEALGHTRDGKTILREATCTQTGLTGYTCGVCGESWTEDSDKLPHPYESVVTEPTCTQGGYTTHTCTACGKRYSDSETKALGHGWNAGVVVTEASCVRNGEMVYRCTRFGCSAVYRKTLAARGHRWEENGSTKLATCTDDGSVNYRCACGAAKTEPIPAMGHDYSVTAVECECPAVSAESYVCRICGDSNADEVAALGHTWNEGAVTAEASCTEDGEKTYTCEGCGEKRTEAVKKTGHRFEDGVCEYCGEAEGGSQLPVEEDNGNGGMWLLFIALIAIIALVLHKLKIFK